MCTGVAPQAGGDYAGQLDGRFVVLLKQGELLLVSLTSLLSHFTLLL